jgi:hypothetical protein
LERRFLGESCGEGGLSCSASAVCREGACVSLKKTLGQNCSTGPKGGDQGDCDDELFCKEDEASPTIHNVCAVRARLGQACDNRYNGTPCLAGSICEGSVCALPSIGLEGESCDARRCAEGLYCDRVCRVRALPVGARCGIVNGEFLPGECVAGSVCGNRDWPNGGGGNDVAYTCRAFPGVGEPCIHDECAAGLFCQSSTLELNGGLPTCVREHGVGEACTSSKSYRPVQCGAGLECRGDVCRARCD